MRCQTDLIRYVLLPNVVLRQALLGWQFLASEKLSLISISLTKTWVIFPACGPIRHQIDRQHKILFQDSIKPTATYFKPSTQHKKCCALIFVCFWIPQLISTLHHFTWIAWSFRIKTKVTHVCKISNHLVSETGFRCRTSETLSFTLSQNKLSCYSPSRVL